MLGSLISGANLTPNMIYETKNNWKKISKIVGKIHKVSDALKFPMFSKKIFTRLFGLQMAALALILSITAYPTHAFDYNLTPVATEEIISPIVITTNSEYLFPLEMAIGMSQDFHALHPGVDLRAPRGTKVLAMAEGTVVEVEEMFIGYGHFVRIAHKGTISSLYAHLDKVTVVPGQKVRQGEIIGTVGLTGWTTGPHLHFEIHSGDKAVDPMSFISQ